MIVQAQVEFLSGQVDNLVGQVGDMDKIERLSKRVEETEQVLQGVPILNKKIETLEVSEYLYSYMSFMSTKTLRH